MADQGEANARRYNNYACQMRSMITGWRDAWQPAMGSVPLLANFTFVEHQLSACTYGGDVPGLRWSQQGSVAPWTDLPNTAMTVGLDLFLLRTMNLSFKPCNSPLILGLFTCHDTFIGRRRYDAESPCANVHIRNKTAVGERMARAAMHVSYGHTELSYTGPVADSFVLSEGALVIGFSGATPPLSFKSIPNQTTEGQSQGIELLLGSNWTQAHAVVTGDLVTVALPKGGASPTAVRYAWQPIPTTQLLFDAVSTPAILPLCVVSRSSLRD